eukprot:6156547-Prymnesium_polylepis.1
MMHTPLYSPTDQEICAGLSRYGVPCLPACPVVSRRCGAAAVIMVVTIHHLISHASIDISSTLCGPAPTLRPARASIGCCRCLAGWEGTRSSTCVTPSAVCVHQGDGVRIRFAEEAASHSPRSVSRPCRLALLRQLPANQVAAA